MFFSVTFVLTLLSTFTTTAIAAEENTGDVQVLTEENFELLTQASTGATTGDWLVEFYAPW